uniref:G-protein coupled receptors family 1 profile domain-containing protein n=1 Tax=Anopheles minimus TaxID=112268 RepID=A0A182W4X0_9DIPT
MLIYRVRIHSSAAVSVSVAVWTLVAISLERYFAICRPLSSRRWQTQFHAYKMIGLVWTVSFLANSPLCYVQRLQPVGRTTGQMKCREVWPDRVWEKAYVLFHDVGLLFLPLLAMGFAYSMIVSKLWRGLRHEIKHSSLYQQTSKPGPSGQGPAGGVAVGAGPGAAGTVGGEQHTHPTAGTGPGTVTTLDTGKSLKSCGTGTGKRHETGFVLTSSLKKGPFKASTAVVNFASNNNTIGKGNFNGGGNGAPSCGGTTTLASTNGAGTSGNPCTSGASNGSNNGSNGVPVSTVEVLDASAEPAVFEASAISSPSTNALGGSSNIPTVNATAAATGDDATLKPDPGYQFSRHAIRSTYMDKSIEAKKKVIRMLFVIIVEFFVCWAPLHILNTVVRDGTMQTFYLVRVTLVGCWFCSHCVPTTLQVYLYSPSFVYQYVNSSGIALVQLMAYISSCCNPITYCFMNRRFRQAFLGIFSCYRNRMPICCCFCCTSKNGPMDGVESKTAAYLRQNTINQSGAERNNSDMSGNDSLVYVGRGLVQRS